MRHRKLTLPLLLFIFMLGCVGAPELTPEQVTEINVLCQDNATCLVNKTNEAKEQIIEARREAREYKNAEDAERWRLCSMIYDYYGKPTHSTHAHIRGRKHRPDQVRDDLMQNECRSILKQSGLWDQS